jgi:lipopolysaccharide transport system permease protein
LIIVPTRGLFDIQIRDLWHYRDLLRLVVRRDFVAQYQQTILGPLWHLIQPVLATMMLVLVFGRIAGIPTGASVPPVVFYMSGITLWTFFAGCVTNTANTFVANATLFGKVYFPRLVLPLSVIVSSAIRFGIQFLLLLVVMAWYALNDHPILIGWRILFVPVIVLLVGALGLGVGITVSAVTTKYRDFATLVNFFIQFGMYLTPVAYPLAFARQKRLGWVIEANPLAPMVEAFRYSLFGTGSFTFSSLSYGAAAAAVAIVVGAVLFNRAEQNFMDTV